MSPAAYTDLIAQIFYDLSMQLVFRQRPIVCPVECINLLSLSSDRNSADMVGATVAVAVAVAESQK